MVKMTWGPLGVYSWQSRSERSEYLIQKTRMMLIHVTRTAFTMEKADGVVRLSAVVTTVKGRHASFVFDAAPMAGLDDQRCGCHP
jgi:hypothetical protein